MGPTLGIYLLQIKPRTKPEAVQKTLFFVTAESEAEVNCEQFPKQAAAYSSFGCKNLAPMTGQLEKGSQVNFTISFTNQVEHIKRAFVMLKCGTPQLKHFESKGMEYLNAKRPIFQATVLEL